MTPKIKFIFIFFIFFGILFGREVFAQEPNILVEIYNENTGSFEALGGGPIFNIDNFLPGDSLSKIIRVHNFSDKNQTIGLKVVNFDKGCQNGYCLADKLFLTIEEDSIPLYSGSLADFYNAGEVPLNEVASQAYRDYDLTVYFAPETEREEYQNSATSFDLQIGFFTKETVSEEPATGGAGYVPPIQGVVTQIIITSSPLVSSDSATVSCTTDIPSYCRVIYDTSSHPDLGNPPNYGYQWSTDPPQTKSTTHQIILTGLQPETTYYYRFVCWASPLKISQEYRFTTLAKKPKEEIAEKKGFGEVILEEEKVKEKRPEEVLERPTKEILPTRKVSPKEEIPEAPTEITPISPTTTSPVKKLPSKLIAGLKILAGANLRDVIEGIISSAPKLALVSLFLLILLGILGRNIYLFVKRKKHL
jgi:hypothetical protein